MIPSVAANEPLTGKLPSRSSRVEMEKHYHELPVHVKEELKKGKLRFADTMIYSIKPANSKMIKMFETQDDREVGLRSISNAKLPKNQCLLVSGIQVLLYWVNPTGASASKDEILNGSLNYIEHIPSLGSSEFSLKANQKTIVPETSVKVFMGMGFTGYPPGYYKLDNPRLIVDETLIEFVFELGTTAGLGNNNVFVFVGLHGTITTP